MKLTAYLRVSTQQQAEHGLGLVVQRAHIREWAKQCGHTINAWESDEGVSGSNGLEDRIGLYSALRAIEEHEVDGLVVYRLDRLARDLILQETLLARIWAQGGAVFSTVDAEADSLDRSGSDPTRNLTRQILGAIAEYERALIIVRLRSGKLAKKIRGGFIGGSVPYGFDLTDDGQLHRNETEQATIDLIRQLRSDGHPFRTICRMLNDEERHSKSGGPWAPATLRRVLLRNLECGSSSSTKHEVTAL